VLYSFGSVNKKYQQKGCYFMPRTRLRVKEIADEKGVNMTVLSHKTFIAINTIRTIFRDPYKSVNTDTLRRIADALEVSVLDLLEEVPDDYEEDRNNSNGA
jgi:DNA-binding Xre family transcriptional regulator